MSMDGVSLLAEDSGQCPRCHKSFSTAPNSDSLETYLSCGHSVCFQCVQFEWCRSSTNDADTVSCPLCNDQALICFDRDTAVDVDKEMLKSARNSMSDVLKNTPIKVSNDLGAMAAVPGRSDVLMSQSLATASGNDGLQSFPMSVGDTFISLSEIDPFTEIQSVDLSESLGLDKCWAIEGINMQEILEKKIEDDTILTQNLPNDSMFTESDDNDIGSVQDILRIVNLPNEALLDDRSLSGFLEDHLQGAENPFQDVEATTSDNQVSQVSGVFQSASGVSSWPSNRQQKGPGAEGVNIHIEDTPSLSFENFPVDGDTMFIPENYASFTLSRGRGRGRGRGKGRGKRRYIKGKRRGVLSSAAMDDGLDLETMAAVAAIEQTDGMESLDTFKENLHERYYPRYSKIEVDSEPVATTANTNMISNKPMSDIGDEIDLPDMQMVKIVSNVDLPTSFTRAPPTKQTSKNNYGYVKNSMLPNGNEIKNLYVVPKTWLNKNDVDIQFAPTDLQSKLRRVLSIPNEGSSSKKDSTVHVTEVPTSSPHVKRLVPENYLERQRHPVKVWSKDDSCQSKAREVYITKIPETVESSDKQVPETVHVRYEVNDGEVQFLPSLSANNSKSEKDPLRISEAEKEPVIIFAIKDDENTSSTSSKANNECPTVSQETNTDYTAGTQVPNVNNTSFPSCYDMNLKKPISMSQYSHKVDTIKNDIGRKIIKVKISRKTVPRQDICTPKPISSESCENKADSFTNNGFCDVVDSEQLSKQEVQPSSVKEVCLTPIPVSQSADDSTNLVDSTVKDLRSADTASCGASTDYGSPPELERADVILPSSTQKPSSDDSKQDFTDPAAMDGSDLNTSDPKADEQYKTLMNKLSELEKMGENMEDIRTLIQQISRLQDMKKVSGITDKHTQILYDMAMSQVFSLVASETSVQLMQANAVLLNEHAVSEMYKLMDLIRQATKQGTRFITALTSEYESLMRKSLPYQKCFSDIAVLTVHDSKEVPREQESSEPNTSELDKIHLISDDDSVIDGNQTILCKLLSETKNSQSQSETKSILEEEEQSRKPNVVEGLRADLSASNISQELTGTDLRSNSALEDIPQCMLKVIDSLSHDCITESPTLNSSETIICFQAEPKDTDDDTATETGTSKTNFGDVANHARDSNVHKDGPEIPQQIQPVHSEENSTFSTCMTAYDSNVALNVEIGPRSTGSSPLLSLSDIMRHSNTYESKKITTQSTSSLESEPEGADPDYKPEENLSSSSSGEEYADHDEETDDVFQNDPCTPMDGKSHKHIQGNETIGSNRKRPPTESHQNDTPRKWRCNSQSETPKSSETTPRKSKPNSATNTPKRPPSTIKRSRKSRKQKMKSIYASSSEEIIPAPVIRGFKDTDTCFKIFNTLYNDHCSDPFSNEILSSEFPDYYKIVKRGMWLDLIAHKLRSGKYGRLEEFVADMRLVFKNSNLINKKGTHIHRSGIMCSQMFERLLAEQFPGRTFPDS